MKFNRSDKMMVLMGDLCDLVSEDQITTLVKLNKLIKFNGILTNQSVLEENKRLKELLKIKPVQEKENKRISRKQQYLISSFWSSRYLEIYNEPYRNFNNTEITLCNELVMTFGEDLVKKRMFYFLSNCGHAELQYIQGKPTFKMFHTVFNTLKIRESMNAGLL